MEYYPEDKMIRNYLMLYRELAKLMDIKTMKIPQDEQDLMEGSK